MVFETLICHPLFIGMVFATSFLSIFIEMSGSIFIFPYDASKTPGLQKLKLQTPSQAIKSNWVTL